MEQTSSRQRALAVVAEDQPLLRMETADFLTDEGYEVTEVTNAAQAMAAVERLGGVDLLFTDVVMPGDQDGADLAREIACRWPDTRIVVCSGMPRPVALPKGALFFEKPFIAGLVRKALR